ncbi:WG repeat-containing protein [Flavobacterium sp. NG2]|uniref:WG repeat-containing protein n=1 Tax=Flavobacterium sp. NG2 TaxID=3097547 RepID=UPI002A82795D|nr:WG repeat-containing protein [Flavobacterium sp. NG2]WPR71459.1 WG repeat-containing protein [Flavobacterium sp. NG2]
MKYTFLLILLTFFSNAIGQKKFRIKVEDTDNWKSIYYIVDEKGEAIKKLDSAKYYMSFNGNGYQSFAIFGIKGKSGWSAIDINEEILFKVYNQGDEINPDNLIENKIRIVDENDKIGFADNNGKIIIKPQFEIATTFHKGKAIIGENCDKIPWEEHAKEEDCHHYSIECKKHGFINQNGEILQIGNFSFEEIQKKIKWKEPELY